MTSPSDPSAEIDAKLATLPEWQATTLTRLRALIHEAVPDVTEEIKWRKPTNPAGVPCWSHNGKLICTGETHKDKVKLTFPHGAKVDDPTGLFNASLTGIRRAIDIPAGVSLDEAAFVALIRAGAEANV